MANNFAGNGSREHPSMTHELDELGEPVHVDIDPFIPTGTCAICVGEVKETESQRLVR